MTAMQPMTLQDIQDRIHVLTSSDPTTPLPGDDQWATRLTLINNAISRWERQDVNWRELFSNFVMPTVITANQTQYPITATAFKELGSLIKLTLGNAQLYLDVLRPEDRVQYNDNGQYCYITGNIKDGFILNLGWVPSTADSLLGYTMSFDYYKYADRMSATTDVSRMSDPDYICYWAAAQELMFNGSNNLAQNYLAEADDSLNKMRIRNATVPAYASGMIADVDIVRNNDMWGE